MAVQSSKSSDKRQAERVPVALPVNVGVRGAQSRDMSGSGIYFETDESYAAGSEVNFSVDLEHVGFGGTVRLFCHGRIVRVDRRAGRVGVAVEIESHRFEIVGTNTRS